MNLLSKKIADAAREKRRINFILTQKALKTPRFSDDAGNGPVSFSHVGLIGDIIYSIPAAYGLAKGRKINLYLEAGKSSGYKKKLKHYNSGKMLTQESIDFLKPLLLSQASIEKCETFSGENIDYDLNTFRQYPFDYRMGHICRWYFLTFATTYDLSKPWIDVAGNHIYSEHIIVSRSFRYRTPGIDYSILKKYSKIGFLGLPDEYEDAKKVIKNIEYIETKNALEMAEILKGCKLFIGNQSFPFSLAEAVKAKRLLEVNFENPNVIVEGPDGFDFCYQPQFEELVKRIIQ